MDVAAFVSSAILLIEFSQCLQIGQPNVCIEKNGKTYCCFNHEYQNGKCKECEIGFTSRDGKPCSFCEKGRYGEKCLGKCDCGQDESCDHIVGCVNLTQRQDATTVLKKLQNTTNVYSKKSLSSEENAPSKSETAQSALIIYISVVAAIILLLVILYIFKWSRQEGVGKANKDETLPPASIQIQPSLYDEIEDVFDA